LPSKIQPRIQSFPPKIEPRIQSFPPKLPPRGSSFLKMPENKATLPFEIPFEEITLLGEIGQGSYGAVYKGKWRESLVAIKTILNVSRDRAAFDHEANLMKSLRPHANVVLFQGICIHENRTMIVTEFLPGGDLWSYICNNKTISTPMIIKLLRGIAAGMLHLSTEGIIHRDLAGRNILLTANLEPKVSDFGMSRIVDSTEVISRTENNIGPVRWMAPECLTENQYSVQSDVWAFGVVIYEITMRQIPYKDLPLNQVAIGIANNKITLPKPVAFPELAQLMTRCMNRTILMRPNFSHICSVLQSIPQ